MTTAGDASISTTHLTVLGRNVRQPVDHLECFDAPAHVTTVRLSSDEVTSICPVTSQPDLSSVVVEYVPRRSCIESKSFKLYLWRFRNLPVFAEALAAEIADEVMTTVAPAYVRVTLVQRPRGGVTIEAVAARHGHD